MKQAILILVTAGAALFFKKDQTAEIVSSVKDGAQTSYSNTANGSRQYAGNVSKSSKSRDEQGNRRNAPGERSCTIMSCYYW